MTQTIENAAPQVASPEAGPRSFDPSRDAWLTPGQRRPTRLRCDQVSGPRFATDDEWTQILTLLDTKHNLATLSPENDAKSKRTFDFNLSSKELAS
jgi:hypothetical protein